MAPHCPPKPSAPTDNGHGMPTTPSPPNGLHGNATIIHTLPFPIIVHLFKKIQPASSQQQSSVAQENGPAEDATEENELNFIPPPEILTQMKSVESLSIIDALKHYSQLVVSTLHKSTCGLC